MAELSLQSLWEMLRGGGQAAPPMSLSGLGAQQPDDPWSRYNQPFGEVRGTAPEDTPVAFQTRNGVRITEGDINRGMDIGLGAATVGGPTKGIRAYHSSPHDFDRFDLSKIGTGEGAQVYGHGIYAAENPAVSGQGGEYWKQFSNRFSGPEARAIDYLKNFSMDREKAARLLASDLRDMKSRLGDVPASREHQEALRLLEGSGPVGPRTYELNIRADPQQMLDWDKPLREQAAFERLPSDLREKLRRAGEETKSGWGDLGAGNRASDFVTGRNVYNDLATDIGMGRAPAPTGFANNPAGGASHILNEAGIPGIKYLDQGSRVLPQTNSIVSRQTKDALLAAQDELAMAMQSGDKAWIARQQARLAEAEAKANPPPPTSNYVIFDPANIDILKKYGLAGLAPLAGAGALQQQPQQEVY